MNTSNNLVRHRLILLSPILIIALGRVTAFFAKSAFNLWAWIPLTFVSWGLFALFMYWGGGKESVRRWLHASHASWKWSALAIVVGLIPLPILLLNWHLFDSPWLIAAWLIFALINPFLEEGYWRGVLLDHTTQWNSVLSILYSSFFFAVNHPLTWGVFSIANNNMATAISTFIMGLAWALVYRKTGSLRWVIISHFLVDLFNLSILTFMNVYIPPY